jgi:glutamyl-Q tRNA(Asp) synthetase
MSPRPLVTRFAPSPTGLLHLGHAFSALFAFDAARRSGGRFLLRIEDIDPGRCRAEFDDAIREDLAWLGLEWEEPVRRQSEHPNDYRDALDRLEGMGLLYPCACTRKEIAAEIERSPHAPHGPEGPVYPGICRGKAGVAPREAALRLDLEKALALTGPLAWHDREAGTVAADPRPFGDVVLARKDVPTSYHLSVTLDDHLQGVTLVTRGRDLFEATHVHRLLQALLGLDVPDYHHHRLLVGPDGRRFAKRDRSLTLRSLRQAGRTPEDIRRMVGVSPSI